MKTLTAEEYTSYYYDNGSRRLYDDQYDRSNILTEKQILSHYKKYVERLFKKTEIVRDEEWDRMKASLPNRCEFMDRLIATGNGEYIELIESLSNGLCKTIDMAHIFSRGGYPHMKYDIDNVVSINRYSHNNLDSMRDPISGDSIDKSVVEGWWRFIVGDERFDRLLKESRHLI